ncbi:MAG TPA: hypothetical protein VGO23_12370 [Pseudonocardia sp.]|nr:hypothetical protein [Pseudonocardia sp.]
MRARMSAASGAAGSIPVATAVLACSWTGAASKAGGCCPEAPATAICRTRALNAGSETSSASSTQASTCSVVGSSGSSVGMLRIAVAIPAPGASATAAASYRR